MKYGIFSDIHSNKEAFEVVLKALEKEKIDHYVFLGDLVGYGAEPKACIEMMKKLISLHPCSYVAGNHDYAVCGQTPYHTYVKYAVEVIEWTKTQLNASDMEFLSQMPLIHSLGDFIGVHANLVSPGDWGYVLDIDDAYLNFSLLDNQICFIGHSHRPICFTASSTIDWQENKKIKIQEGTKYIINVGSVGQPRDGNPQLSFAIYDTNRKTVEVKRLDYEIRSVQEKIVKAGLPRILADRLSIGM